jgi:predicted nuclease of predicted toxin-antitoxin system
MKLLFDHNLSPKLVTRLNDLYLNSNHLYLMNLDREPDHIIWGIAKTENYDSYHQRFRHNSIVLLQSFKNAIKIRFRGDLIGALSLMQPVLLTILF